MTGMEQAFSSLSWMNLAACRAPDVDRRWFFPEDAGNYQTRRRWIANAQAICAHCPVRKSCEQYADHNGERDGVWGGQDRDRNRNRDRAARCGTEAGANRHRRQGEDVCPACATAAATAVRLRIRRKEEAA